VRLQARRHHHRNAVEQLVAAIGAIVPLQELGKAHALGGNRSHATKLADERSQMKIQLFAGAAPSCANRTIKGPRRTPRSINSTSSHLAA
jgi:hypothetical protein